VGHFVGKDFARYYVEDGKVYDAPNGRLLDLNSETLEPKKSAEAPPVVPSGISSVVEIVHSQGCTGKGRFGRYTKDCPKCEEMKNG